MNINKLPEFENRIGEILGGSDNRKVQKLQAIKNEIIQVLKSGGLDPTQVTFCEESIKLISESLMHIMLKVPGKNQALVQDVASKEINVLNAVIKTVKDPDIRVDISGNANDTSISNLETMPSHEIFVGPAQKELEESIKELKDGLKGTLDRDSDLANKFKDLEEGFNHLGCHVFNDFINRKPVSKERIDREAYLISYPDRAHHVQNVLVDDYSYNKPGVTGKVYDEGRIYGDGNCGFSCCNTTREDVVNYLLKYADKDDKDSRHVRSLIAPEIKGWLMTEGGQFATDRMSRHSDPGGRDLIVDYDYEKEIEKLANDKETYKKYITEWYGKGKYLVIPESTDAFHGNAVDTKKEKALSGGVLDVIALMKGTPFRIWRRVENSDTVYLYYQTKSTPENKRMTLDIVHRNNPDHFNKLVPVGDQEPFMEDLQPGAKKQFSRLLQPGE